MRAPCLSTEPCRTLVRALLSSLCRRHLVPSPDSSCMTVTEFCWWGKPVWVSVPWAGHSKTYDWYEAWIVGVLCEVFVVPQTACGPSLGWRCTARFLTLGPHAQIAREVVGRYSNSRQMY